MSQIRLLMALALLLTGAAVARANDWPTIRVGTEGAMEPFNYRAADGTLRGFDVDIAQALCDRLKARCEFVALQFDGIILALQQGRIDAIATSMSVTEKRKKVVDFTERYYTSYRRFLACGPWSGPTDPEAMENHSIGVQGGTASDEYLEAHYANSIIRLHQTIDEAFADLAAGRIETMLSGEAAAYAFLKAHPACRFVSERVSDPKLAPAVAIAVRKTDPDLRDKLNGALRQILADGTYDAITAKYFPFSIY